MPTPPSTRALVLSMLLSLSFALPGCWTAPRAESHPRAMSGLVIDHILVHWNADNALVQTIDPQARTLRLATHLRRSSELYPISASVSGFEHLRPGDRIRATLVDELSVYMANAGITTDRIPPAARILSVDPAYRLLTIKFHDNGEEQTFKVDLHVKLNCIHAGDAVAFRPLKLTAFRTWK